MTRVWDAAFPTLAMKLIALKLADCANDEGENIYPSVGRVERETGASSSTVREALADMEAAGLLVVTECGDGNKRGRSTTIRAFNLDLLKRLGDEAMRWVQIDVPVRDKDGHPKRNEDGSEKLRRAWRLAPPVAGPLPPPVSGGDPSGERTPPLRWADPTPPVSGAPYKEEPSLEPSLNHPHTSEPPDLFNVCVGGGKPVDAVLIELGQAETGQHVVESYIRPLWGALRLPAGVEAVPFLAGIRDALAVVEPEVLERAALMTQRSRTVWPSPAQAYKIANDAAVDVPLKRFEREHPAFRGWLAHYRATGRGFWARECEARGYVLERSAVPVPTPKSPGKAA